MPPHPAAPAVQEQLDDEGPVAEMLGHWFTAPAPGRRAPRAPRRAPRADGDQNRGVGRYTVPPRSRNSRDFSAMPSWAIRSWEAASP